MTRFSQWSRDEWPPKPIAAYAEGDALRWLALVQTEAHGGEATAEPRTQPPAPPRL